MGRKKGSKNKPKIINTELSNNEPLLVKRGRGRPKGSKGKSKLILRQEQAVPLDIKEIRRQLRVLRKIKKDTHKGSEDRHDLCRKIRELRKQLKPILQEISPSKQKLIDEILLKRPEYERIGLDLYKYTEEQLIKHFNNIQGKPRLI